MEFYFGLHSVMNTNLEAFLVQRKYVNQQISPLWTKWNVYQCLVWLWLAVFEEKADKLFVCICKECFFQTLLLMAEKKNAKIIHFCSIMWT